jgi:hypothetical protein
MNSDIDFSGIIGVVDGMTDAELSLLVNCAQVAGDEDGDSEMSDDEQATYAGLSDDGRAVVDAVRQITPGTCSAGDFAAERAMCKMKHQQADQKQDEGFADEANTLHDEGFAHEERSGNIQLALENGDTDALARATAG